MPDRRLISSGSDFERQSAYSRAVVDGEADATLADVVRVRYIVPDPGDFPATWPVLRRYFGDVRPAATMISCGLADPRMKIEIEVTAHRDSRPAS
jgi:enamine deaminase RidA (YjgF/YER057c/UK114 family)